MKSEELMIGDWVKVNNTPYRIYALKGSGAIKLTDAAMEAPLHFASDFLEDSIKPIPLTREILEKNGFVYEKDYGTFYRSRWGDISSPKCITISWCNGKMTGFDVQNAERTGILPPRKVAYGSVVLSVHELQRALRCCGLFDLANNLKIN